MSREEVKEAAKQVRDTQTNAPEEIGSKLLHAARDIEGLENGNDVQDLQDFSRELHGLGFPDITIVDYNDGKHDGEPKGTLDIVDSTSAGGYYTADIEDGHLIYTRNDDTQINIDLANGRETTRDPYGKVTERTEPGGQIISENVAPNDGDLYQYEKPKQDGTNGNNPSQSSEQPPEVPPQYRVLANEQQLEVRARTVDGKTQYEFHTGDEQVVLSTEQPPQVVQAQLKHAQAEKVKELEETYNVDFAEDGEKLENNNHQATMTTPTLGELAAVEQSLRRSTANLDTRSGKPLKIFIGDKGQDTTEDAGNAFVDGSILMEYQDNLTNLTNVTVHELAHVGQLEQFEDFDMSPEYANRLGWTKLGNDFLLRDKEGGLWKRAPGNSDDENETNNQDTWMRVDAEGNPANSKGERTDQSWNPFDHGEDSAQVVSQETMIEMMEVAPATGYIKNPIEMGADLLTEFRKDSSSRSRINEKSPATYELAKQLDQEQVNSEFGTENGEPRMIRNQDGILVPNTPQSRQLIADWESTFR